MSSFTLGVGTYAHLKSSRIGDLQKINDPFPRILLYVRSPPRKEPETRYNNTKIIQGKCLESVEIARLA